MEDVTPALSSITLYLHPSGSEWHRHRGEGPGRHLVTSLTAAGGPQSPLDSLNFVIFVFFASTRAASRAAAGNANCPRRRPGARDALAGPPLSPQPRGWPGDPCCP